MSKALLRSNVPPTLVHQFDTLKLGVPRKLEVWTTTCIVHNFGKPTLDDSVDRNKRHVLVNPSNQELSGCANFSYFPRGGPVPTKNVTSMHKDWQPLGYVSNWGGMEVGSGMMYPVSVVDGLVHQSGGWKLKAQLDWKRLSGKRPLCPEGTAVSTTSASEPLVDLYDEIVHTTPPFYNTSPSDCVIPTPPNNENRARNSFALSDNEKLLARCYDSAFSLAFKDCGDQPVRTAIPLLGAGARGFPEQDAVKVAATALTKWLSDDAAMRKESATTPEDCNVVAVGLLETSVANQLIDTIQHRLSGY